MGLAGNHQGDKGWLLSLFGLDLYVERRNRHHPPNLAAMAGALAARLGWMLVVGRASDQGPLEGPPLGDGRQGQT